MKLIIPAKPLVFSFIMLKKSVIPLVKTRALALVKIAEGTDFLELSFLCLLEC